MYRLNCWLTGYDDLDIEKNEYYLELLKIPHLKLLCIATKP